MSGKQARIEAQEKRLLEQMAKKKKEPVNDDQLLARTKSKKRKRKQRVSESEEPERNSKGKKKKKKRKTDV